MKKVDYDAIRKAILDYTEDMVSFTRDMTKIKSLDSHEGEVIQRVKAEMEKIGFDEIRIDPMGNIIGKVGHGTRAIAFDAHVDTVDAGDIAAWDLDPFSGLVEDGKVHGRGSSDQKGALASAIYAVKAMKELDMLEDLTIFVTGTVNEEECDGLCWQYIAKEDGIRPELAVITEATNGRITRGQRGRMNIKIITKGLSAHGSVPELGINAVYKMAPIILDIEQLDKNLEPEECLGKGSITVTQIFFNSVSSCAVPDECVITIDRRLTLGETEETALNQLRNLESVRKADAKVEMFIYNEPCYTGLVYPTNCYFPTWLLDEDHPAISAAREAYSGFFKKDIPVGTWSFSTNGVSIMGMYNIPCIGYGPGREEYAHAPNEFVLVSDLQDAAMMYAAIPSLYLSKV
ncbi:MAG TPA: YgeY family selenium metabolism-linked hydrolase [Negativicutes bacterium]|nr:YgeY family selenium metabolism-linked hydrolase [Negativicutes bacterium]